MTALRYEFKLYQSKSKVMGAEILLYETTGGMLSPITVVLCWVAL